MKNSSRLNIGLAILASMTLANSASAVVSIDYVTVGHPGNEDDPADGDLWTNGLQRYGAVDHDFGIAKNETTIGQYAEFLNTVARSDPYGLYNTAMASAPATATAGITRSGSDGTYGYSVIGSSVNKPITLVSWFDAARFCNWLHNGQGSGGTETGAYTLNGAMSGIYTVNPGAKNWIPSEDEWYKAAYYDATKDGIGGYWRYPTQSDLLGGNTIGAAYSSNYFDGDYVASGSSSPPTTDGLTNVGAYGANSDSFYGTNDQGGNVVEWTDAVTGSSRGTRGGEWSSQEGNISSAFRFDLLPSDEGFSLGFRVATIPEPGCLVLALLASGVLAARRNRRAVE